MCWKYSHHISLKLRLSIKRPYAIESGFTRQHLCQTVFSNTFHISHAPPKNTDGQLPCHLSLASLILPLDEILNEISLLHYHVFPKCIKWYTISDYNAKSWSLMTEIMNQVIYDVFNERPGRTEALHLCYFFLKPLS